VSGSDPVRQPATDVRFTYDDFLQFPDDGKRHELTLRLPDIFEE
jgi:hypothetical protein